MHGSDDCFFFPSFLFFSLRARFHLSHKLLPVLGIGESCLGGGGEGGWVFFIYLRYIAVAQTCSGDYDPPCPSQVCRSLLTGGRKKKKNHLLVLSSPSLPQLGDRGARGKGPRLSISRGREDLTSMQIRSNQFTTHRQPSAHAGSNSQPAAAANSWNGDGDGMGPLFGSFYYIFLFFPCPVGSGRVRSGIYHNIVRV